MLISSYDELKAKIASTLNRSDLTDDIPGFVQSAEAYLNRKLRAREMEDYRVDYTVSGQFTVPTDLLELRNIQVEDNARQLRSVSRSYLDGLAPSGGLPCYYSMQGMEILFYPSPDDGTAIQYRYLKSIPALSDSNTSNWLLVRAPDLYLYASLFYSAPFLDDDSRIMTWKALRDEALEILNDSERKAVATARPVMTNETAGYY